MRRLYTSLLFVCFLATSNAQLVDYELIDQYDIPRIQALASQLGVPSFVIQFNYEIDVYKIEYKTQITLGDTVIASGALMVPKNITCGLPIASYQHGTTFLRSNVPSNKSGEYPIGLLYGTNGYFIAMPDYIGLGVSNEFHPFIHAESAGYTVVDMIRASRELAEILDARMNDQVMLFGYSQGGYTTLAAQKMMEEQYPSEFNLVASNPMSGPYDISGIQFEILLTDEPYPTPSYFPYTLLGLQSVYGNLYTDLSDIFVAPYDTLIPSLMDGEHDFDAVNTPLPNRPSQMLKSTVLNDIANNPNNPIKAALVEQNLFSGWTPKAPIRFTYCIGDEQIPYLHSIKAFDSLQVPNVTMIELLDMGNETHTACANPALISGLFYISQFSKTDNGIDTSNLEVINVSTAGGDDGSINFDLEGGVGPFSFLWSNGEMTQSISGLSSGFYSVDITDSVGCSKSYSFFVQDGAVNTTELNPSPIEVFPNPVSHSLTIKVDQLASQGHLVIRNINGSEVFTTMINTQQAQIEIGHLANGLYTLELNDGKHHWTKRMVISKP